MGEDGHSGGCQCGRVRFRVDGPLGRASICHCRMCQKATGNYFAPYVSFRKGAVTWTRGDRKLYRSSNFAQRGFCGDCGTHLFYRLLPTGEYILPAGLFQDRDFTLASQIFIDEKPAFYALANDTETLTGQQVFARFASDNG